MAPSLQSSVYRLELSAETETAACCRQQLLLLTRVNCEHVNTEQCRARPGEAASVYNCVEQETLISAGGGKNCQTRALNSQQSSPMLASIYLLYTDIHNMYLILSAKQF